MMALLGLCLVHTFLGAPPESSITCSDASSHGGAVAVARVLSPAGKSFLQSQEDDHRGVRVPVVVISLFNGIGGSYRCYDLAGVEIVGGLSVELHPPANRVMSRRWPGIEQWEDIRTLTIDDIEAVLTRCEPFEQIHVWGGFPCVDLSRAKFKRKNLGGSQSSLIHEGWRICKEVRGRYQDKVVRHVIENVSSMDVSARDEISEIVGSIPYKLDPRNQVPMARPRFCWTDLELWEIEGLKLHHKDGYVEVEIDGTWPDPRAWLDNDSYQNDDQVIYPTCMKSIPRFQPPEMPAGLSRCDPDTVNRWSCTWVTWIPWTTPLMKRPDAKSLRAQRKLKRGTLSLEDRGIAASTRLRYFIAVRKVLPLLQQTPGSEDEIIGTWIEESYQEGEAITTISDTLSGLHHFAPHLKGHLGASWRLFRLWRRIEKPTQAPPLPLSFASALVARAIETDHLDLAVMVALGFWGMLRTGELLSLFPFQVLLGGDNAIIQLGATKSGLRRNQDENVVIEHTPTLLLLRTWIYIRKLDKTLYSPAYLQGPVAFRKDFRSLMDYFQLSKAFRPYSLRRGGATQDFRGHGQMERTLIRGRWASNVAARQYIQEGLSILVSLRISPEQAKRIRSYATTF
eukprot:Skav222893  [mRNA]  locus=scaffold1102:245989:248623:- [translate_table: standard]